MGQLNIAVLGSPEVRHAGRTVPFPTRKTEALLLYLAVEGGLHARDRLAALLWPESDETRSRASLRRALSDLQRVLQMETGDPSHLLVERDRLGLSAASDIEVDLSALAFGVELARAAKREPRAAFVTQLRVAAGVYKGELLEGFSLGDAPDFDVWVSRQREAWHRRAELVLDRLSQELEEGGDLVDGIETSARWVDLDPLNETACRRLMRLHYAAGDRSAALRAYDSYRLVLIDDLGAEPASETRALAERIRRDISPPDGRSAPNMELRPTFLEAPLVGRANEHARMAAAFRLARRGQAQAVVIDGESGIGKTRLAREFLRWTAAQGADLLQARAFEAGGRLPYQPLVDALRPRLERENAPDDLLSDAWLTELGRLLPELRERYPDLPAAAGDDSAAKARLFEAVTRVGTALAARAPVVLYVDDAQWADLASLDVLQYAARRWATDGTPVLLIMCLRSEDLDSTPALSDWLSGLGRSLALTRLSLAPLTREDTSRLMRSLVPPDQVSVAAPDLEQLDQRLFAETRGHPFFVVEIVKALLEGGLLERDRGSLVEFALPASVQELVRARVTRLTPAARAVLSAAAVLGARVDLGSVRRVAGLSEDEALPALDDLLALRLMGTAGRALVFPHDQIREVAYADSGEPRRRLYHERALDLLDGGGAAPAELVRHALAADLPDRALSLSIAAGDDALRMCAARDAVAHYERARELSPGAPDPYVLLQLGRAYELATEYAQAQSAYEELLGAAQAASDRRAECAALNRLATLSEVGGFDLAAKAAYLHAARAAADASGDPAVQAETAWNLSRLGVYQLELDNAREQAARALSLAQELGLSELSGRVLNWTAMIDRLSGQWLQGLAHVKEARAIFAMLGDRVMEADCLAIEAGIRTMLGQPRDAEVAGRAAYTMNLEIGNAPGQADAGEELAVALLDCGEYVAALEVIQAGIAAARAIGHAPSLITCIALLGTMHRTLGGLDAALAAHAEAWSIAEGVDYPLFTEHVAAELCADHAERGDWTTAASQARVAMQARGQHTAVYVGRTRWYETEALVRAGEADVAVEDVRRFGQRVGETSRFRISYLRALAVLASARGEHVAAITALEEAGELADTCGLPGEVWPIHVALDRIYRARGAVDQAREAGAQATRIVQELAGRLCDEGVRTAFVRAAAASMES